MSLLWTRAVRLNLSSPTNPLPHLKPSFKNFSSMGSSQHPIFMQNDTVSILLVPTLNSYFDEIAIVISITLNLVEALCLLACLFFTMLSLVISSCRLKRLMLTRMMCDTLSWLMPHSNRHLSETSSAHFWMKPQHSNKFLTVALSLLK